MGQEDPEFSEGHSLRLKRLIGKVRKLREGHECSCLLFLLRSVTRVLACNYSLYLSSSAKSFTCFNWLVVPEELNCKPDTHEGRALGTHNKAIGGLGAFVLVFGPRAARLWGPIS